MWRICRKTLTLRWHVSRQNPVENKNKKFSKPIVAVCPVTGKKGYHDDNKKGHADKQGKGCWDDPNFHFNSYRSLLLETAGWLGTAAALCINIHLKHFKCILDHDQPSSPCLFSRNVLAMPRLGPSQERTAKNGPVSDLSQLHLKRDNVLNEADILQIKELSDRYVAAVENAVGISSLKSNDRKAFRCFQTAARLGSAQALYNLGLCYESGKGTPVNLQRAAFCYRKAAMKGHAMASFNLAVFFMKGLGGLPSDAETAKLLLAEAAEQGVLEAQLYLGIDYLECGKYEDAFVIFENLSLKECSDAQYYLGLCFENGWGTQKDEKAAFDLYSKAALKGHSEASKQKEMISKKKKCDNEKFNHFPLSLLHLLQRYRDSQFLTYPDAKPPAQPPTTSRTSTIHVSASAPVLTARAKTSATNNKNPSPPTYLDLVIPHFSIRTDSCKAKFNFPQSISDQNLSPELSASLALSVSNLAPQVMEIKI